MFSSPVLLCTSLLSIVTFMVTRGQAQLLQQHSLDVYVVKETPSSMQVMWFLRKGDLKFVHKFQFTVTSETGETLINSELQRNQRSISLKPISPDALFNITIKAVESHGLPMTQKKIHVKFTTEPGTDQVDKKIFFIANEIRSRQARLAWALHNVDVTKVKNIRLHIERQGPSDPPQVITRLLSPEKRTFLFSRIPVNSFLCVTLEAIGLDDKPFLNSALHFNTTARGRVPVKGSSLPLASLLDDCCSECRWAPLMLTSN